MPFEWGFTQRYSNSAAPLLAKSFNNILFAVISAVAFTTVLGTPIIISKALWDSLSDDERQALEEYGGRLVYTSDAVVYSSTVLFADAP